MAPCCLFTRRLIVKELISGCTGNKKLIFELFVSCTSASALRASADKSAAIL
jgi:hypothetical protein